MRWILAAVLAGLIAVAGATALAYSGLHSAAAVAGTSRVFTVKDGEPLARVAERLERAGLLEENPLFGPRAWVWYARARGLDRSVKSGEYDLAPTMTPVEILAKLTTGEVKTYAVTFPEGLHVGEIAERLAQAQIAPRDELVKAALSPELARSLGIEADTLEGYLYPETYRFRRGTPAEAVLRTMVEHFFERMTEDERAKLAASGMTLHQVVTLASIVEKETGVAEERPLIAAVFRNRLQKRMRLQSDPTVIYGMVRARGRFDGNLRKVDLQTDTPYNTYTRGGLPPGPIASVSMDSIRAVLDPADARYLYFVSRNDGTHYFSNTLEEHANAVRKYQRYRR
jgi:UPF0755 protein